LHTSPSKDQKKTPKDVPDKKKDGQMLYLKEWWCGSDGKILTKRAWKKMEKNYFMCFRAHVDRKIGDSISRSTQDDCH